MGEEFQLITNHKKMLTVKKNKKTKTKKEAVATLTKLKLKVGNESLSFCIDKIDKTINLMLKLKENSAVWQKT